MRLFGYRFKYHKHEISGSGLFLVPVLTLVCLIFPVAGTPASETRYGEITYLKEAAFVGETQKGPWKSLEKGMMISEGDFIKTEKTGLVELILPDKSIIRLSSDTIFRVEQLQKPEKGPKKFSMNLILGRAWAKLTEFVPFRGDTFNMHIPTAVIGVRGTVYNTDSSADNSADIYVFEGIVGVAPPLFSDKGPKEEITWPKEVSEKEWEEIILKKLQRLHIGPDGKPGQPQYFDPAKEKDEWIIWNRERDAESII